MSVRGVRSGRDTVIVQGDIVNGTDRIELTPQGRKELIDVVWTQRIVNGLNRSVGQAAEISLSLRDSTNLVKLSYRRTPTDNWAPTTIAEAYDQAGGELVILGAPGAGKTTQALILIRTLLERAKTNLGPIPEVFVLASWAKQPTPKPFLDWLGEEVRRRHGYPLEMATRLISDHQIVPILDGLDEVAPAQRGTCVAAINEFWLDHRRGPLVVSSRGVEYQALDERLNIGAVVTLEPPSDDEVDRYLTAVSGVIG